MKGTNFHVFTKANDRLDIDLAIICFQPYPATNFLFERVTGEHESHNYWPSGRLFC